QRGPGGNRATVPAVIRSGAIASPTLRHSGASRNPVRHHFNFDDIADSDGGRMDPGSRRDDIGVSSGGVAQTKTPLTASHVSCIQPHSLTTSWLIMMTTDSLSATFGALADPTRRAILARLATGEASVKELAEPFDMSLQAISKHLRVLERGGLIVR